MKSLNLLQALGLAVLLCAACAAAASAQSRYTPPAQAPLSPDLTAPWVLQLRNKPSADGTYAVQVARPQALPSAQLRRTIPAFEQRRVQQATRQQVTRHQPVRQQAMRNLSGVSFPQQVPASATPGPQRRSDSQTQAGQGFDPKFEIHTVAYDTDKPAGSIVIDTRERFLYLVEANGMARRYGIGVGRDGFRWSGTEKIARKAEWPSWTPPKEMIAREAARGHHIPDFMEGGPANPLGARALYLGDTLYRIHGTNQPWTIGQAVSSGCIRMRNEDVMDLYERVRIGATVVVS